MTSSKLQSYFKELSDFFEVIPTTYGPIELKKDVVVHDVGKFIESHINIMKTYQGYIINLALLREILEQEMHSDLHKLNET